MADEQTQSPFNRPSVVPDGLDWASLLRLDGDELEVHYRHILTELGKQPGMLGIVFRKAQNRIQDPAKLRRLIVDLIDREQWMTLDADVKGDAYEGLLQKNAEDTKSGAGQYFTPRPLIRRDVDVYATRTVADPICDPLVAPAAFCFQGLRALIGTIGSVFILARRRQLAGTKPSNTAWRSLTTHQARPLRDERRLPWNNCRLRGESPDPRSTTRHIRPTSGHDLRVWCSPTRRRARSLIRLRLSSENGESRRDDLTVVRDDFWATTIQQTAQLWFSMSRLLLKIEGRAADRGARISAFRGVVPVRRCGGCLLHECDVHTLLRLPTGSLLLRLKASKQTSCSSTGSQRPEPFRQRVALWVYDLRTNMHFTLKENPLRREHLEDFTACYHADNRAQRAETDRFHRFTYDEIVVRDKVSLDLFWLRDESLEDAANLPEPHVLAAEILEDLEVALSGRILSEVAASLRTLAPQSS